MVDFMRIREIAKKFLPEGEPFVFDEREYFASHTDLAPGHFGKNILAYIQTCAFKLGPARKYEEILKGFSYPIYCDMIYIPETIRSPWLWVLELYHSDHELCSELLQLSSAAIEALYEKVVFDLPPTYFYILREYVEQPCEPQTRKRLALRSLFEFVSFKSELKRVIVPRSLYTLYISALYNSQARFRILPYGLDYDFFLPAGFEDPTIQKIAEKIAIGDKHFIDLMLDEKFEQALVEVKLNGL